VIQVCMAKRVEGWMFIESGTCIEGDREDRQCKDKEEVRVVAAAP
jgi:hypothetical protein